MRDNPYYIYAPDYSENSSGIVVLHKLCHILNVKGFESYIVGASILNDKFKTCLLTEDVVRKHKISNKVPIVVYPEVVSGNPIGGDVCVRYFLNKNGLISGAKTVVSTDDLIFYFSDELSEGEGFDNVNILTVDPTRHDLFFLEKDNVRNDAFFYVNRIPEGNVDLANFESGLKILSARMPMSLNDLSKLFKRARVLYTYEYSWTCILAILCGCPVVQMRHPNFPELSFHDKHHKMWGRFGYVDDISNIEEAIKTAPRIKEVFEGFENIFEDQFDNFIRLTQKRAQDVSLLPNLSINHWISKRVINKPSCVGFFGNVDERVLVLQKKENSFSFFDVNLESWFNNEAIDLGFFYKPSDLEYSDLNNLLIDQGWDWILILKEGDELTFSGLFVAQIEISKKRPLSAISFDTIYRQKNGDLGAAFLPSINLDYLLSFPAGVSKHWLFNRQALLDIGGFNPQLPDALELDAILRLINHGGLEDLGHIAEPLVITQAPALANIDDERKAIEAHLQQRGYADAQVHAPKPGRYQIRYNHPQEPIVSIVIIAETNLTHMQRCVEGLLSDTSYQNFEVLLFATQNTSSEVSAWLDELARLQEAKLRIFSFPEGDWAEQYNQAALQAIGDYLLFLSADTSVVSAHWLDELLNHAQRGEVGVVGAKLVSPVGKIAHAGHILGLEGPLGSPFVGEDLEAPGYMQRLQVDQNLSAVGIDCFMVLRELFVELDGFAENQLATEYLSADFCLRAREAGFLTVWTPHAQLMLEREVQVRPSSEQQDAMYAKWLPQLARDPAYNPNFSLSMPGGFKLADSQISWRPLEGFRPEPVALVHPADLFGCGHYRVMQPFLAMKEAGLFDGAISTGLMHVTDLERYNPDTIILQRQIGDERLEAMQRMQRFSKAFKVYELDDYLPNLPLKSVHRANMPKDILRSLRKGLSFVDRFVVSTGALAEAFSELHNEIVVMENRLPVSWWQGLQTQRRQGKKPRVGWAGGSSHTGDLELIADVVRDLADEVEWVFLGMCPDKLRPYVHEYHDGVAIEQYPAKLASLNLDLGLAPLEMNLFNECKSNLRLLEYGACGIPVVCTDIRCYQNDFPVTRVRNRYKDWIEAIRMHINDLDRAAKLGDDLQAKVRQEWMLEGTNLELWRKAWLPS